MSEVSIERFIPNSERFEELPGIRQSLLAENNEGNVVVARLSRVRDGGRHCACGCGQEFMMGGESVLTKAIDAETEGEGRWNRYTTLHFIPVLDSWQNVRTISADLTTDKALEQRAKKQEQKARQAAYEEQRTQRERSERDAQRRYIVANGRVWLSGG